MRSLRKFGLILLIIVVAASSFYSLSSIQPPTVSEAYDHTATCYGNYGPGYIIVVDGPCPAVPTHT